VYPLSNLSVVLLHEEMLDKNGKVVITSLTLNDIGDLSRSCRTYGVNTLFIAHPSAAQQKLARRLEYHWEQGFGATYNVTRKDAFAIVKIVPNLDEAILHIEFKTRELPKLIATSARPGENRVSFGELASIFRNSPSPHLLMLGSGWGMSEKLLARADYVLEPIICTEDFNHLSVRSAGAVMLDRLSAA